jgi:hypothetical protein
MSSVGFLESSPTYIPVVPLFIRSSISMSLPWVISLFLSIEVLTLIPLRLGGGFHQGASRLRKGSGARKGGITSSANVLSSFLPSLLFQLDFLGPALGRLNAMRRHSSGLIQFWKNFFRGFWHISHYGAIIGDGRMNAWKQAL